MLFTRNTNKDFFKHVKWRFIKIYRERICINSEKQTWIRSFIFSIVFVSSCVEVTQPETNTILKRKSESMFVFPSLYILSLPSIFKMLNIKFIHIISRLWNESLIGHDFSCMLPRMSDIIPPSIFVFVSLETRLWHTCIWSCNEVWR